MKITKRKITKEFQEACEVIKLLCLGKGTFSDYLLVSVYASLGLLVGAILL